MAYNLQQTKTKFIYKQFFFVKQTIDNILYQKKKKLIVTYLYNIQYYSGVVYMLFVKRGKIPGMATLATSITEVPKRLKILIL